MKYCLGTVQFGQDYGIQGSIQPQRKAVYEMLSYAIENGIREFDTAAAYGEAEQVLGEYIRAYPDMAEKMNIVSKLHPEAFTSCEKSKWPEAAVKHAEESLEQLGIDQFSAYHFHRAQYLFQPEAVEALYTIKKAGLTSRIGAATYTPEEAMKALETDVIDAIQIPYNVFDRRLDQCGFFEEAGKKNIRIYARSSLLQGLLLMDPNHLPERVSFAKPYLEQFRSICREYQVSLLEAAIGYAASKKETDYIVFGVDNQKQLEEYLAIREKHLSDEMIREFDQAFMNVEEKLVNPVLWR